MYRNLSFLDRQHIEVSLLNAIADKPSNSSKSLGFSISLITFYLVYGLSISLIN